MQPFAMVTGFVWCVICLYLVPGIKMATSSEDASAAADLSSHLISDLTPDLTSELTSDLTDATARVGQRLVQLVGALVA